MRSLSALQPWLAPYAEWLFRVGRRADSSLVVTSSRRTYAEQVELWEKFKAGRSGGLPVAPPGHSMHQLGRAFDMARANVDPFKDDLLPQLGDLWLRMGGTWHPSDPVHFEA